ncbi:MAG: SMI1/KNR4 family protein [Limisphaerales bacterium]
MSLDWSTIVKSNNTPLTAETIVGFEEKDGYRLPVDYRSILMKHNGGTVVVDHEIPTDSLEDSVYVTRLYPLVADPAQVSVVRRRNVHEGERTGIRQAVEIGGDMGTGCFFLMLAGPTIGAIYYIYQDDLRILDFRKWLSAAVAIPSTMHLVADSFDELGKLILRYRTES